MITCSSPTLCFPHIWSKLTEINSFKRNELILFTVLIRENGAHVKLYDVGIMPLCCFIKIIVLKNVWYETYWYNRKSFTKK